MQIFPRHRNTYSLLLMNCSSSIQSRIFWRIFTSHEKMPRLQVHRCIINFYPWHFELRSTKDFFFHIAYIYLFFFRYMINRKLNYHVFGIVLHRHIHIKLMTFCSKMYFFVETSRGIKKSWKWIWYDVTI